MTQLQVVIGIWLVFALVILVSIWLLVRDIVTRAYYQKKAEEGFIVAEFLSKVGLAFTELVKIEDKDTGRFTYKDRIYWAGRERVTIAYPPGRSKAAQVNMQKCYPNPASSDMATNLYGKPTVDAVIVGAVVQQGDTKEAMERSREESGMGTTMNRQLKWVYIGLGCIGLVSVLGLVFTIKYQMGMSDMLMGMSDMLTALKPTIDALAAAYGVK